MALHSFLLFFNVKPRQDVNNYASSQLSFLFSAMSFQDVEDHGSPQLSFLLFNVMSSWDVDDYDFLVFLMPYLVRM